MGVKEIRTVVKCDFNKPAAEQDGFHVRGPSGRSPPKTKDGSELTIE
jgi:hypothetical protein